MTEEKELNIVKMSEKEATERLAATYLDPDGIKDAIKKAGNARAEALSSFVKQTNDDPKLAKALWENPVGVLTHEGLLAPFDNLTVDYGSIAGGPNMSHVLEGVWGIPGHRPRCIQICRQAFEIVSWEWVGLSASDSTEFYWETPIYLPRFRLVFHCQWLRV